MDTVPEACVAPKLGTNSSPQQDGVVSGLLPKSVCNRTIWLVFFFAMAASFFLHELGHCAAAWMHGYAAIPTPMKEYLRGPVLEAHQNHVALGGIIGSTLAVIAACLLFAPKPDGVRSSLLASALVGPGFYALRFALAGRGHDATEFQEAQAALGLLYGGHAMDWFFVALLLIAAVFWVWRARVRLSFRLVGRLFLGALFGIVALAVLQKVNNAIFDPFFEEKPTPVRL